MNNLNIRQSDGRLVKDLAALKRADPRRLPNQFYNIIDPLVSTPHVRVVLVENNRAILDGNGKVPTLIGSRVYFGETTEEAAVRTLRETLRLEVGTDVELHGAIRVQQVTASDRTSDRFEFVYFAEKKYGTAKSESELVFVDHIDRGLKDSVKDALQVSGVFDQNGQAPNLLHIPFFTNGGTNYGHEEGKIILKESLEKTLIDLGNASTPTELKIEIYHLVRDLVPLFYTDQVIVNRADGTVILGKRLNEPLKGQLSIPGGRMFFGEHVNVAATRKIEEETGLIVGQDVELHGVFDVQRITFAEGQLRDCFNFVQLAVRNGGALRTGNQNSEFVFAEHIGNWSPFVQQAIHASKVLESNAGKPEKIEIPSFTE